MNVERTGKCLQQVNHVAKKMKYMDGISCLQIINHLAKSGHLWIFFLLVIVLSILLQFTYSDYPFGIFELFVANLIAHPYVPSFNHVIHYLHTYISTV
jgi:hypothetical protein